MSLSLRLRRANAPEPHESSGPVRIDARTKNLTKRLRPGDIAVINHLDLDKVSAEALVACRPAAIINAAASISGRYPNLGPEIIVAAGIPLLDAVGDEVMTAVKDGELAQLVDAGLEVRGHIVATGELLTAESV
ncbi:MAG: hypothetical protein ABI243_04540, partial [Lapillicoccus sp.]